ncbi:MAG: hypothetical protein ABW065_11375 [Solirubrobacterales bacterium]
MKRLKGGPELKMPDVKVPLFLEELYYDLRDRRLLPLVALVLVAIVAVPFLLSGGPSDSEEGAAPAPQAGASTAPGANAAQLTVVKAEPGLRDYRKRLRERSATDPFRQPASATDLSGTALGSPGDNGFESSSTVRTSSTSVTSGETTKTTKTTKTENGKTTTESKTETTNGEQPSEGQGGSGEGGSGGSTQGGNLYSYSIDFRMVRTVTNADGKAESDDPVTRTNVLAAVPLPSEKVPVVTFLGTSTKTHMPLFLISGEVTSVFGEGKCLSGTSSCQLMELEVGMPVTFVYGADGARYKFTILKVEPVVVGHS